MGGEWCAPELSTHKLVDVDPQQETVAITLPTKRFLFHAFFDGDVCERSAIVASMASDAPCFDPFLLHIRLAALRAHKYPFDVVNFSNFFHIRLPDRGSHRSLKDCKTMEVAAMAPGSRRFLTAIPSAGTMPPS